jgi:hypothetical protein
VLGVFLEDVGPDADGAIEVGVGDKGCGFGAQGFGLCAFDLSGFQKQEVGEAVGLVTATQERFELVDDGGVFGLNLKDLFKEWRDEFGVAHAVMGEFERGFEALKAFGAVEV